MEKLSSSLNNLNSGKKWEIVDLWGNEESWKMGVDFAKTIVEIMNECGNVFMDTPSGRELRNKAKLFKKRKVGGLVIKKFEKAGGELQR